MKMLRWMSVVVGAGALAACSKPGATPGAGTPVSATVAVSPAPGARGVTLEPTIGVAFGSSMDSASVVGRFAVHMGDSTGPLVPGHMMWDSTYRHMTFVPDSALAPGTMYSVYMHDGMMTRGAMMGGGGRMGGMGARGGNGAGMRMMFDQAMPGAMHTGAGMLWSFTTGK